jgi:hypothetical protein
MNIIHRAVVMVDEVIGILLGQDFDTPIDVVSGKYPTLSTVPYGR